MAKFPTLILKPGLDLSRTLRMFDFDQLTERAEAMERYVAHQAAAIMLEEVKGKIPNDPRYTSYRDALQLVQMGPPANPTFAVFAKEAKVDTIDSKTDLLYFKPLRGKKRTPELDVLIRHQPWTQETLPFEADPKIASMVIRRVSDREAKAVTDARQKDKPVWSAALSKLGIQRPPKKDAMPKGGAVQDMVYTALRLEFGLGGTKAVAHWRPAYRTTQQRIDKLFKGKEFAAVMMNWKNTKWKKWRNLSEPIVPSSTAGSSAFADKIT